MNSKLDQIRSEYLSPEYSKWISENTVVGNVSFIKDNVAVNNAVFALIDSTKHTGKLSTNLFDQIAELVTPLFEAYPGLDVSTEYEAAMNMGSPWEQHVSSPAEYALCVCSTTIESDEFTMDESVTKELRILIRYAFKKGADFNFIADKVQWLTRNNRDLERAVFTSLTHNSVHPLIAHRVQSRQDLVKHFVDNGHDEDMIRDFISDLVPLDPRYAVSRSLTKDVKAGRINPSMGCSDSMKPKLTKTFKETALVSV